MDNNKRLDLAEIYDLHEYLLKMDQLAEREPDDRSGDDWKAWKKEAAAVNKEYDAVINKALADMTDRDDAPQNVAELLKYYIASYSPKIEFIPDGAQLEHTHPAQPSRYGMQGDKMNRVLVAGGEYIEQELDGQFALKWAIDQSRPESPPVPVSVALIYEGDDPITNQKITGEDEIYLNTVCNMIFPFYEAGKGGPYNFTSDDIWRTLRGISDNKITPSPAQKKKLCASLDKMSFTRAIMDLTAEINDPKSRLNDWDISEAIKSDYLLPASKEYLRTEKGREYIGYSFYKMPFLYEYNMKKGNVVLVDFDLLDVSDTIKRSREYTDIVKFYLLAQIGLMYHHKRNSSRILYDSLYKAKSIPTPAERADQKKYNNDKTRQAAINRYAKDDRDEIAAMLESWTRKGWIKGHTPVKKGRFLVGVDIILNPEKMETAPRIEKK